VSEKNCKIVELQWLLSIVFASPLGFNTCEQVAAAAGRNLVCD
jgi:hypothetical protein